jgi:hypothetical protein
MLGTRREVVFDIGDAGPSPAPRSPILPLRWRVLACLVAVAGVLAAVLGTRHTPAPQPRPVAANPTPPPAVGSLGAGIAVGPGSPVGLVIAPDYHLYVVRDQPARLAEYAQILGRTLHDVAVPAHPRLLALDPNYETHRLWVVCGADPVRIQSYDTRTLRLTSDQTVPAVPTTGVVLDGVLYLGGPGGLLAATVSAPPRRVPAPAGLADRAVAAMAADGSADRLVVASPGAPTALWTVSSAGRVTSGPTLPLAHAALAAVNGQVWVSGTDPGGTHLVRLDAGTLHPVQRLDEGSAIVGTGDDVVWTHDAGRTLTCVDAFTGQALARFVEPPGPVASILGVTGHPAWAIGGGRLITLELPDRCQG